MECNELVSSLPTLSLPVSLISLFLGANTRSKSASLSTGKIIWGSYHFTLYLISNTILVQTSNLYSCTSPNRNGYFHINWSEILMFWRIEQRELSMHKLNLRSDQWNCTKPSTIGGDVRSSRECDGQAFMAACSGLCNQSGARRRCWCGKYLLIYLYSLCCVEVITKSCLFQVLEGQKVVPAKAKELGFSFKYPYVKDALKAILS